MTYLIADRRLVPVAPLRRFCARAVLVWLAIAGFGSLQAAELQVGNLEDIDFGRVPPTVREVRSTASFCVALEPGGRYNITALGDGPGGSFSLQQSGGLSALEYQVQVSDRGRRRGQRVQPGIALRGLRARSPRRNGTCRRPFGTITAVVPGVTLRAARPGFYRGTLSLTVAPE